jgi:hypothetical protein
VVRRWNSTRYRVGNYPLPDIPSDAPKHASSIRNAGKSNDIMTTFYSYNMRSANKAVRQDVYGRVRACHVERQLIAYYICSTSFMKNPKLLVSSRCIVVFEDMWSDCHFFALKVLLNFKLNKTMSFCKSLVSRKYLQEESTICEAREGKISSCSLVAS